MGRITASRKQLVGDPRFDNLLVAKFVNNLMLDGKKNIAFKIFYDALELVEKKVSEEKSSCFSE